jgi:hypothetical protein
MPRIRTLKPEFWRNRQLAILPEFTRLLAIALLNIADDEGYFEADPRLIRGDVFPFEEDSRSTTVGLRELSGIGYVVIREHSSKGPIGYIPTFKKHQVINKARRSQLAVLFGEATPQNAGENTENPRENDDYGSTPVVVREDYGSTTGGLPPGTGNREQGTEEGEQGTREGEGKNSCASAAPSHQTKREKYPPDFEAFWQAFPAERRRGKPDALKAWKRATDLTEPQTLIDAAKRYAVSPKAKAGFARMPATWLRAEAWTEDEAAWQGGHTPTAGERRQQRNDEVIGKFFGGSSDGSEGSFAGLIRDLSGGAE